jgi:pimeloyl-ACP methyl ester carboxylesterase
MSAFSIEPFELQTDPADLDDLRTRLRRTRWADAPSPLDTSGAPGWSLGADVDELRALIEYWADGFDWLAVEAELNRLPHRRASVGGLSVHLVHARAAPGPGTGDGARALPLVLSHGWPDSFWRYTKVIPLLTDPGAHGGDPADAFDVIVPDMPGFGYSEHPPTPLNSRQVAALWAELMTGLGYPRFVVAGGDIGSHVSRYLALDAPDRVIAVHRTDAGLPPATIDPSTLTDDERIWLQQAAAWGASEGAYAAMHRSKPQTAAVGLTDSPAGLAAWIVEKLRSWSDLRPDRALERAYTRDEVLTNLTIYWLTGTIGSSMRMYSANGTLPPEQLMRRVEAPSGFSLFPGDIVRPPRAWLDRTAHTVSVTEPERGGHFSAFEQPELYAEELRAFFRPYRPESGGSAERPARQGRQERQQRQELA